MQIANFDDIRRLADDAGEIQDGRFAVVAEKLFDVTRYDGKYVIAVFHADEAYNASHSDALCAADSKENFISAQITENAAAASMLFTTLIAEACDAHFS